VETAYTVNEVAEKSGYSYAYYFIKVFKNHYGTTPNEYRSANRNHPRS
jgi:AraC-like DNA-binding protein